MIGRDLPALAIRRPLLVLVLNLLIALAGLAAVLGVEVRELPDIDRPVVTVRGDLPGASPETVDVEVTALVEGAVARVAGVKEVRSSVVSQFDFFRRADGVSVCASGPGTRPYHVGERRSD